MHSIVSVCARATTDSISDDSIFLGKSSVSAKVTLVNILLRNYRRHFLDEANGPDYRN